MQRYQINCVVFPGQGKGKGLNPRLAFPASLTLPKSPARKVDDAVLGPVSINVFPVLLDEPHMASFLGQPQQDIRILQEARCHQRSPGKYRIPLGVKDQGRNLDAVEPR